MSITSAFHWFCPESSARISFQDSFPLFKTSPSQKTLFCYTNADTYLPKRLYGY